jgi:hypothetical protein
LRFRGVIWKIPFAEKVKDKDGVTPEEEVKSLLFGKPMC